MEKHKYVIYVIILIAILCMIFLHFVELTDFATKYNFNYDYGNFLKGLCKKEFFEYETSRFQMAANKEDIKISGTDEKKYNIIILVVTIVVFAYVSLVFSSTLFAYMGNSDHCIYLWFLRIIAFSVIVYGIIYLALIFTINVDISPVLNMLSFKDGLYGFLTFQTYIYLCFIVCIIIYVINFNNTNAVEFLPTSATYLGMFFTALFLIFYIVIFYILGSVINIIKNPDNSEDARDHIVSDSVDNISTRLFESIFGYKNINYSSGYNQLYVRKISAVFCIVWILLLIVTVLYLFCEYVFKVFYDPEDTKNYKLRDRNLLKYGIMFPLIILFIVMLVGSVATEYNTVVNKYVLYDPIYYYKIYVKRLNDMFNKLLSIEYKTVPESKEIYICKNYANAILCVLYAHLFKNVEYIVMQPKSYTIDLTPEFTYSTMCDTVVAYPYADKREYDVGYYLNAKSVKKNIFYNFEKCDEVNEKVVYSIGSNLLNISNLTNYNTLKDIYNAGSKTDKTIVDAVKEILPLGINKIDIGMLHTALINVSQGHIYYNNNKQILYFDDNATNIQLLESYNLNNKLKYDGITALNPDSIASNVLINKYKTYIEDNITKEYENMSYEILYAYSKSLYNASNVTSNVIKSRYFATETTNIITKYFKEINENLSKPFTIENGNLTKYIIGNYNSLADPAKMYNSKVLKFEGKQELDKGYDFITFIKDLYSLYQIQVKNDDITRKEILKKFTASKDNKAEQKTIVMEMKTELINNYYDSYLDDAIMKADMNKYKFIPEANGKQLAVYEKGAEQLKDINDADKYRTRFNIAYNLIKTYENYLSLADGDAKNKFDIGDNVKIFWDRADRYKTKTESIGDTSKRTAKNIIKNAQTANELVYFVIILYILAVLSTNLIIT